MKYILLGVLAVLISVVLIGCGKAPKPYQPKDEAEQVIMDATKNSDRVIVDMRADGEPIESPAMGRMPASRMQAYKISVKSKKDGSKAPTEMTIYYNMDTKKIGMPPPAGVMNRAAPSK